MPVSETLWDSYLEGQLPYCRASVVIGAKPIWGGEDRNLGGGGGNRPPPLPHAGYGPGLHSSKNRKYTA